MWGKGGCTALGNGAKSKTARQQAPVASRSLAMERGTVSSTGASVHPTTYSKPLIKRAPSARPHDAETGFVIACSSSSSLTAAASLHAIARGYPETVLIAVASLERARSCLHSSKRAKRTTTTSHRQTESVAPRLTVSGLVSGCAGGQAAASTRSFSYPKPRVPACRLQ